MSPLTFEREDDDIRELFLSTTFTKQQHKDLLEWNATGPDRNNIPKSCRKMQLGDFYSKRQLSPITEAGVFPTDDKTTEQFASLYKKGTELAEYPEDCRLGATSILTSANNGT